MKAELTCGGFEARIHELLDQRLPLDSCNQLLEHSTHCQFCAMTLLEYQLVLTGRNSLTESSGLPRIRSAPDADRSFARPSLRRLRKDAWGLAPSFAALLMVALGMWWASQYQASDRQLAGTPFPYSNTLSSPRIQSFESPTGDLARSGKSNELASESAGGPGVENALPNHEFPISDPIGGLNHRSVADHAFPQSLAASDRFPGGEEEPFSLNSPWNSLRARQFASPDGILELTKSYRALPEQIQRQTMALWDPEPLEYLKAGFVPWHPLLNHTAEFWGIHPATSSVVLTLNWLQKSIMKAQPRSGSPTPDLGSQLESGRWLFPFWTVATASPIFQNHVGGVGLQT